MKEDTRLIAAGRPRQRPSHPVNPPVERASTILFATYDDFVEGSRAIVYGRLGTSTHRALEEAICALEGGVETRLAPSGLQAAVVPLLAFTQAGDRVLIADTVYDPTRKFCDRFLARFGVEVAYYDPSIGEDVAKLITERTKVIFAESPGSLTFEVQDIPALARAADKTGAKLVVDNTWAAGYYCKPLALGADVSLQAGTKYLCGHSDCLIGSITSSSQACAKAIYNCLLQIGANVSADDAWLTLRGIRTLAPRLARHQETGLAIAKWLAKRPEVARILHPALTGTPGHSLWKRDFTGSSGLFGAVLHPIETEPLKAFFNALRLFGMGWSWGGFESLIVPVRPEASRTAIPWTEEGPVIRLHAGLEDCDDLMADLNQAFMAMAAAKG